MKSLYLCFLFGGMILGCSSPQESPSQNSTPEENSIPLPEHVQQLENLSVFSPDDFSSNVSVQLDLVFTETEDVFFGYAGNIAVDQLGRLYIETGSEMGQKQIYAFNEDGQFIKQIGRYGRGPGEFENIHDIKIYDNKLFVYEDYEVHVFHLSDLSFSHSFVIEMDGLPNESSIHGHQPSNILHLQKDSSFLFSFEPHLRKRVTIGEDTIYYNFVNSDGVIDPQPIFQQRDFSFFNQTEEGSLPRTLPFAMPFIPSSLTAVSKDGRIFSAWNEDFLIKIYDLSGNYVESIYMPVQPAPLPKEHALNLGRYKQRIDVLEEADIPDSWPVVDRILVDKQNRLWTATITESDSTFKWFVFDVNLDPLATFILKGERAERQVWLPKDMIIKDNHLYQIQPYANRQAAEVYRYKVMSDEVIK